MHIIKTLSDIREKQMSQVVSKSLGKYLESKILAIKPETDVENFSSTARGPFGVLEKGDNSLSAIGLPDSLAEIMPEWVSRLEVSGEVYYVLYIMANNNQVVQLYLPDEILEETLRRWLSEQPMEAEAGCDYDKF